MQSQPNRAVYKSTSELGDTSLYRTAKLCPEGVLYREVPLYKEGSGSAACESYILTQHIQLCTAGYREVTCGLGSLQWEHV